MKDLRAQTGDHARASQSGSLAMGTPRREAIKVVLKPEWKTKEAKIRARQSDGVMPKQAGDFNFANQMSNVR
jgi:hypothetical protein